MWETLSLILLIQVLFFLLTSIYRTDKLTDLSYGLTFVALAAYLWFQHPHNWPLLLMPILWGVRLGSYLFIRILQTHTDHRFDQIRTQLSSLAKFWFLQAMSIALISWPLVVYANQAQPHPFTSWLGLVIFGIGLVIESLADHQKYTFKQKHPHQFIRTGLWRYSRHPNYFGEMLVWTGIYLFGLGNLSGLTHLVIISPIYITLLLIFGSGVPTLEKNYQRKYGPSWLDYQRRTSMIIPWFSGLA